MTGYGETGPMSTHSSYGPMLEAYAGFAAATGYIGEEPLRIGLAFPDAVGGAARRVRPARRAVGARADGRSPCTSTSRSWRRCSAFAGEAVLAASTDGVGPGAPRQPLRRPRAAGRVPLRRRRRVGRRHGARRRRVGALVDLARTTTCSRRSPTPTSRRRAAAHDEIDAALGRWTSIASAARRGQGAAVDRRRRLPGVHEPRPRARRAPRGARLHRRRGTTPTSAASATPAHRSTSPARR